ncbi:MAG: lamin tail domain-containing protein [Thermoanaerobaculia bacterium]|nr:lamin tail domain-containing protein [Thermoanaerobaculia bacterium]
MKNHATRHVALLALLSLFFSAKNTLRAQDVILQGFYWNTHPGDVTNTTTGGIWWDTLTAVAPQLAAAGFDAVWTPPPTKSFAGVWDMGYGTYDYFDLGSIFSKGTTRTRHGSRAELDAMISALHSNGIKVMADVVLNHRGGADAIAPYQVNGFGSGYNVFTPPSNRIPSGPEDVHPTNQHPDLNPDYHNRVFFEDICHFNENDANPPTNPDGTAGSWWFGAPTLMGSMGDSLIMWGRWLVNDVGYDELRLDAVKHIDPWFIKKFLIESKNGAQPFAVGESFEYGISNLVNYWNQVQDPANSGGVKNAKISLFDFPLRGSLKSVLNNTSGTADLYNTLGNAGLVWGSTMGGFDVVTWLESHDTDRQGYIGASMGCPIPYGSSCLELHTENDHDPVISDKEDMGYPFLLAAEGRPVVFWKDWYWYGMADDIKWQIALRQATATGASDHIHNMGGFWPTDPPYDGDNHGGNMFALRRDGLTGGVSDGMVLGLNDDDDKEHAVWVNTPFTNKYLKDYSDGYLFKTTQAFGDSRALIKAQKRDYSWWSPTGLYPKPAGTPASHFSMGATPGGCPHFIAVCAVDAANLIVNGAPIAAGDELAVKNAAGQVTGIGRIGQGFKWDGAHDMIIEVLGSPSTNGMAPNEVFRLFVYDASMNTEVEVGTVQYAATSAVFTFAPERPNSPNRNGNFSTFPLLTTAQAAFTCEAISRIIAFNTHVAAHQPVCIGDNAGSSTYTGGLWPNGSNSGTGLGAWSLSSSGSAGFFTGTAAANGNGDNNSDGDINTSGVAWGTWANSGGEANALRAFAADLTPGSTFTLKMDNGDIDNGASVGFGLKNSSGNDLFEFYYRGGDAVNSYKRNDNDGEQNIGLVFTDEGLALQFTLLTATTYQMAVTPLGGGSTVTFSGALKNPAGGQSINRVRLFNYNAGSGGARDAFFNSIGICYPPSIIINEVDYNQPNAPDGAEFIELKNVGSDAVNLDPYKLELLNSVGTVYATVDLPAINLAAGDYFVICGTGNNVPNCDYNFAGATDQINDGAPAAIRLVLNNSVTTDAMSYEGSVTGASEGTGVAAGDNNSTSGVGLSRIPDSNDTDQNNSDFILTCITPGSANVSNTNSDGDTYPDYCDNCPDDANETQADTDEDAIGDACDDCLLAVDGISNFNTSSCNCNPGYYPVTEVRNSQTVIIGCQPCPAGSYCPDGINAILCPVGKYSNVTGATACLNCAAGSYQDQQGQTSCIACPPGKFSNVTGATACQSCAAGSYQDQPGQSSCTACPPGSFSSATGSVACQSCAAGSYQDQPGQTSCTACPPGSFSNVTGSVACQSCAAGSYQDQPGQTSCTACPPGKFSNVTGSVTCQNCGINTYSSGNGSTECLSCGNGFYSPEGSAACSECNVSFTATPTDESCAGMEDGEIDITNVTGGTAPFMYSINNGANYGASSTFTGLASGTYQVRVKDFYDCESDAVSVDIGGDVCPLEFSGTILWEHDDASGVKDATVNLTGAGTGNDLTDMNGDYLISVPPVNGDYTLTPVKNINKLNGLSVADALAIQQHLTNITPITDPYKMVAADVNKSNSITTFDAVLIKQVLLNNPGANNIFNTSWRFVPASWSLPTPPWGFPEQINLTGVNSNQSNQDFIGIKLGDLVANYADPASFGGGSAGIEPFEWQADDQVLETFGPLSVLFTTGAFDHLAGLQCAFRFDTTRLRFDSLTTLPAIPMSTADFGLGETDSGKIRLAWSTAQSVDLDPGDEAFRLYFTILQPGGLLSSALRLDDSLLQGLAVNRNLEETTVKLTFSNASGVNDPGTNTLPRLLQNRPNPFSKSTTIGFVLPASCEASLRVTDVNGREVWQTNKAYPAGYHEEKIELDAGSGVLFCELITPWGTVGRKMVAGGSR